jgi:hypothetical protein
MLGDDGSRVRFREEKVRLSDFCADLTLILAINVSVFLLRGLLWTQPSAGYHCVFW